MMNKGCCFRLAAWLALSGLPGAGMAEMLPAEEVLLPAPSACRSEGAAVHHCRNMLQGLHQVGLDRVLHQRGHRAFRMQV